MSARGLSPPPLYDSPSHATTTLKPYLELPHLLSLTWLAYPILSLLFVVFRLQLSVASAQGSVAGAKQDLLSSCNAAQHAATAAASMPRYLAVAVNHQITNAVNDMLDAARDTMILALTIMEAIINFIVDTYRSTFLCFLELVVRGGLSILIGFVQEANSFLSSTLGSIRTSIQNDVSSANSAIASAVNEINKINPFGNISVPQFSIPSLTSLENVTLPSDFESALISLNNSLPTLSTLKSDLDSILDTPFELVVKEINETFANMTFTVNALPIPQQNTLTFCDNLDTSVVDDLARDIVKVAKIGTVILLVLAVLLLASNCLLEWYKWRLLKKHLQRTRDAWTSDPSVYNITVAKTSVPTVDMSDHNLMVLQADALHPHLMKIANMLARLFRMSPSQYIHLRWFFHYVFHPPALACFLIGFFGLLSVQIQIIAIRPLADKYSQQAAASVSGYTDLIATSINSSMYNQSSVYADQVNAQVDIVQSTVNDGLFGWVNSTTTTLNDTINAFYNDLQDAVSTVFNGTILESPVSEFIKCFIGGKVSDIEIALTFLHNNLNINIPRVNESALVLSSAQVNEMTAPIATAAVGGGSNNSTGILGTLIADYIEGLKKERIMFSIFMGLWGIVVLMALAIIFWHAYGRDWLEAHRRRKWQRRQRAGINGLVIPFRNTSTSTPVPPLKDEDGGEMVEVNLPSFTPMPSPHPRSGIFDGIRTSMRRHSGTPSQGHLLQPPSHPLSMRKPQFEKSWDSFLDHSAAAASAQRHSSSPSISHPTKLMSLGSRGRERFTGDEKQADVEGGASDKHTTSWFPRLWNVMRKNDRAEEQMDETSSPRARARPQLTIRVDAPSTESDDLTVVDGADVDDTPRSAWSVSPVLSPPKLPWMHKQTPARKSDLPSSHTSKPLRTDVPVSVDSVYGPPEPQFPVAVPLHHGFEPDPSMPHIRVLVPPSLHPTIIAHSSQAVDPFVTPFDDEHQVPDVQVSSDPFSVRRSIPTNPFIAMAL
ncbi:hypothetical protein BKA93DRAFT_780396 [Sparassis latifolia]|uniref:Plasma membrane fusion protein PRM1 n=1 Tax=Sparassis crispa TaxID=139825 RepID=A0A401GF52_9APHY|nr:Plasma membrane fusion protein [Sparassis crispa]GBE80733.1 Plasma membrane fusion protein [Sparassis crispa]